MNAKIIKAVENFINLENSRNSVYGLQFKGKFNSHNVNLEVVTLNGRCELGICSYNKELADNKTFLQAFKVFENTLKEIANN